MEYVTDALPTPSRTGKAIVLSGGGVAGVAWELGLLAGLLERGVDLSDADLVVGTSAGSVVGSILAGGDIDSSRAAIDAPTAETIPATDPAGAEQLMVRFTGAAQAGGGPAEVRARIGAIARGAGSMSEEQSVASIASLIPAGPWPPRLKVTAVDAEDGSFVVFDAGSGVELARAVTASCAVPGVFPTITVAGRPMMDGGVRSTTNADVAAGHDRVLVVACSVEPATSPTGPTLRQTAADLGTEHVLVVQADAVSIRAFGTNTLSVASRVASAEAGRRQAGLVAGAVRAFWASAR